MAKVHNELVGMDFNRLNRYPATAMGFFLMPLIKSFLHLMQQ
jgi:hypothetical protein